MRAGPSSLSISSRNKVRGVYSRLAAGRVSGGDGGAVWGIFRGGACLAASIGVASWARLGVKVGREKLVECHRTHAFPPFFALDPLMGRWFAAFLGADRGRRLDPLGRSRPAGHPVAQSGPEIWKISARSAGFNMFLRSDQAPYAKSPQNGSGCGRIARQFSIKRVGDRLIFAGKARAASILGLSGPELEAVTLGGGLVHVN